VISSLIDSDMSISPADLVDGTRTLTRVLIPLGAEGLPMLLVATLLGEENP
jgi:hypothetical protein